MHSHLRLRTKENHSQLTWVHAPMHTRPMTVHLPFPRSKASLRDIPDFPMTRRVPSILKQHNRVPPARPGSVNPLVS